MDKKNTFELEVIGSQKCFGDLPALSTYRFNNGRLNSVTRHVKVELGHSSESTSTDDREE